MPKVFIWRSNLDAARERCSLTSEENAVLDDMFGSQSKDVSVHVEKLPISYARALLEDSKLKPNQRAILTLYVHGMRGEDLNCDRVYDLRVAAPVEFGSTLGMLNRNRPNAGIYWNGRWYPVAVQIDLREDEQKLAKHVLARVSLALGQTVHEVWQEVDASLFIDETGGPVELSVLQVLERLGFRRLQTAASEFNLRLLNADRLSNEHGKQVWVNSAVLELQRRFWLGAGLTQLPLGTKEMPRRAIIEPVLQDSQEDGFYAGFGRNTRQGASRLPLVRIFSLDTKSYVFADVDDLETYEYDEHALSKLYLPPDMKSVL